jgi:hypothetical protein
MPNRYPKIKLEIWDFTDGDGKKATLTAILK